MQMRFFLLLVVVLKVAARLECKQYHDDCTGCLAAKKTFVSNDKCSYCVHVNPETGETGYQPKCTSHPETTVTHWFKADDPPVCPELDEDGKATGWTHTRRTEQNRKNAEMTCKNLKAQKAAEADDIKTHIKESDDPELTSPGSHTKAINPDYRTEKRGLVVNDRDMTGDVHRVHLSERDTITLKDKYKAYLTNAKAQKVSAKKHLSFSKFVGVVRNACSSDAMNALFNALKMSANEPVTPEAMDKNIESIRQMGKLVHVLLGGVQLGPELDIGVWINGDVCTKVFKNKGDQGSGVAYLNAEAREAYEYKVSSGHRIVSKSNNHVNLDTCDMETDERGKGWAIYVVSHEGRIYSGNHVVGSFHHSSFLAGAPAKAAGEWLVRDGKIIAISDKTGHYHMSAIHLAAFLSQLYDNSPSLLKDTKAAHLDHTKNRYLVLPATVMVAMRAEMQHGKGHTERMSLKQKYDEANQKGDKAAQAKHGAALKKAYGDLAEEWNTKIRAHGDTEDVDHSKSANGPLSKMFSKAVADCPNKNLERSFGSKALTSAHAFALQPDPTLSRTTNSVKKMSKEAELERDNELGDAVREIEATLDSLKAKRDLKNKRRARAHVNTKHDDGAESMLRAALTLADLEANGRL